ncbi:hypothetical protein P43SY_001750 [Pythium insidiosum]|uniref:PWWP domain-containing protein n=1 Tax=Pythium insidiosum TaxID=114742 RepID=A0AAD5LR40_PYTIN|nr:hypothetical protein P43SY_001750 [Pythium insidiosum]
MAETDGKPRPEIPMELGLRVDILDSEGIWNTGRIVDVSREEEDMVEVKYDGWGDEYNEWVPLAASRLAPLHMYTMVKKCWAKLNKWPWWPAFVVLRAPTRKSAADALEEETKLYVEFFDSFDEDKRSRCWMQKKNVASFQEGFDERASKNIGKNFPVYVEGTQRAMAGGSPLLFSGHGTLPIEFSSKYAAPLAKRKQELVESDEKWHEAYRIFSDRYKLLYGFEYARDPAKKVLAAHAAKTGGKHAGKQEAASAAPGEDNDDLEVIEEVVEEPAPTKSGGRGRGAGRGRGSGRGRGRGRPPTSGRATATGRGGKKAANAEEEEEVEEITSLGSDTKVEPEEEEASAGEADDETHGRRSTRVTKKRQHDEEQTAVARRSSRARRTKGSQ